MVGIGHLANLIMYTRILRKQGISDLLLFFFPVIPKELKFEDIGFIGDLLGDLRVTKIRRLKDAVKIFLEA